MRDVPDPLQQLGQMLLNKKIGRSIWYACDPSDDL